MSQPLFSLGQILGSPEALDLMLAEGIDPRELLTRHASGDWGDIPEEEARENDLSLRTRMPIVSAYRLPKTEQQIWITTEADRTQTIPKPCSLSPRSTPSQIATPTFNPTRPRQAFGLGAGFFALCKEGLLAPGLFPITGGCYASRRRERIEGGKLRGGTERSQRDRGSDVTGRLPPGCRFFCDPTPSQSHQTLSRPLFGLGTGSKRGGADGTQPLFRHRGLSEGNHRQPHRPAPKSDSLRVVSGKPLLAGAGTGVSLPLRRNGIPLNPAEPSANLPPKPQENQGGALPNAFESDPPPTGKPSSRAFALRAWACLPQKPSEPTTPGEATKPVITLGAEQRYPGGEVFCAV